MFFARDQLVIVFYGCSYPVINLSSKYPATNRGGVVVGSARQLYRRPISLMISTIPSTTPHPSSKINLQLRATLVQDKTIISIFIFLYR
jgi:hypothetical protein